ncbi:hypothetical protein VCRA2116O141_230024 [Vibrio crassostreae]|nr:hypothetical protein VCRA2116O141_230024 [Vibrio crassostreae]CAK2901084.1 hypothetical protein VCRA2120O150_280006 [Vibrio crassostreae]CAK3191556.1 hypothetical protein VCRA2121O156_180064 [Vibrio crassostreae]CAK3881128.1 hypothetical protein VCRA2120O254_280006 [Vibrio crassostreae]
MTNSVQRLMTENLYDLVLLSYIRIPYLPHNANSISMIKNTILQSVTRIGNIVVSPITHESGRYKGKRIIQGGRKMVVTLTLC